MTRAGYLWRNGVTYKRIDSINPPLCWTNWNPRAEAVSQNLFSVQSVEDETSGRLLALASPLTATKPKVVRTSSPAFFEPSKKVTVTLSVTAGEDTLVYAIEENIPPDCIVTEISPGGSVDKINNMIKWGPYIAPNFTPQVSYALTPNSTTATSIPLSGIASFDGSEIPFEGISIIRKLGFSFEPFVLSNPAFSPSAGFSLAIQNNLGAEVVLERSADLSAWISVNTQTVSHLPFLIHDSSATNLPARFYRVFSP